MKVGTWQNLNTCLVPHSCLCIILCIYCICRPNLFFYRISNYLIKAEKLFPCILVGTEQTVRVGGLSYFLIFYARLQDSFEIPRDQSSKNGDIEMGTQIAQNSGDLGLDNFFKQVL